MSAVHIGDRRAHLRFQVVGTMPASLLGTETLHVVNLGTSGALVECAMALAIDAEYRMQLVLESHISETTVKIRRVIPVVQYSGPTRYRIGLEFLTVSAEAEEMIDRIIAANGTEA